MHKSKWNYNLEFSGLEKEIFSESEQKLISKLIKDDLWIEEESNVLKDMYNHILSL